MEYKCEGCFGLVAKEDAFIRSSSFRRVAWCQVCWRVRNDLPLTAAMVPAADRATTSESVPGRIPGQRQAPAIERAQRRWRQRRHLAGR